jgi:DNA-binding MarR family transcriptional regulator
VPPELDLIAEARRNWERHAFGEGDAMEAATSIARAHQVVMAAADRALAPFGLTFSRFEALALLHFSRRGALPMGRVGARLQVHATSVTTLVDRLERDGLVRRVPAAGDRRSVLAQITDRGREVVPRAAEALAAVRFGLAGVDEGEVRAVATSLRAVRRAAGDLPAAT